MKIGWRPGASRASGRCFFMPKPDWSPGDVIAVYEDGTIVLDDGLTTWNPERAQEFLAASITPDTPPAPRDR
jgi:hypothetical protein